MLGRPKGGDGTCRHGYGLDFQRRTGQTQCAYCGLSLVDSYDHWLLMALDHVVPAGEIARLGIPADFGADCINLVLVCSACNGFKNRFTVLENLALPRAELDDWTLDPFLTLRDAVFAARRQQVAQRREIEKMFFTDQPWLGPDSDEGPGADSR
ncbi:MAG: HNH endonuclease [Chloroflexota bacterium]